LQVPDSEDFKNSPTEIFHQLTMKLI